MNFTLINLKIYYFLELNSDSDDSDFDDSVLDENFVPDSEDSEDSDIEGIILFDL